MSYALPEATLTPSRLQRIVCLVKNMLAVVAALDSAEAITLRDKRRILSTQLHTARPDNNGVAGQSLDHPQQQRHQAQSDCSLMVPISMGATD